MARKQTRRGAAGRPACVRGSSCVRALRTQRNGRRATAAQGALALLRRGGATPAPLSERATDARPRRTQRRGASTQRRASRRTPIATARRAEPSSLAACAEASSDAGRLAQGRSFWAHELQRPLRSNPVCRCSLEQSGLVLHFLFSRNSLLRVAPCSHKTRRFNRMRPFPLAEHYLRLATIPTSRIDRKAFTRRRRGDSVRWAMTGLREQ